MRVKFYTPHLLLQEFINCVMIVHVKAGEHNTSMICPYPPTPQNSLFFYINDQISVQKEGDTHFVCQPRSVIVGPQLNRVTLDINQDHKAVRVGFHPGGLYRMLGIPMIGMVDESYDAPRNYGWYQCRWHAAAANIYNAGGKQVGSKLWTALQGQQEKLTDEQWVAFLSTYADKSVADMVLHWDRAAAGNGS